MSKTAEKGHAKNIANLELLNNHILELGNKYNPSNPKLSLTNLQTIYNNAFAQQKNVNTLIAPYSLAVDNREEIFKPLNTQITKLRKAYKATQGVDNAQMDDFMTISRKLKGIKKVKVAATNNPEQEQKQHSTAQLSYDQRTNNMDLMISLLQNTKNYNPNEVEHQVATYQELKNQMLATTQAVTKAYIPLNTARSNRNAIMYNDEDNLVDTATKAINYLFSILDSKSSEYKAISKIKFVRVFK
jgi:hypothetical protein